MDQQALQVAAEHELLNLHRPAEGRHTLFVVWHIVPAQVQGARALVVKLLKAVVQALDSEFCVLVKQQIQRAGIDQARLQEAQPDRLKILCFAIQSKCCTGWVLIQPDRVPRPQCHLQQRLH